MLVWACVVRMCDQRLPYVCEDGGKCLSVFGLFHSWVSECMYIRMTYEVWSHVCVCVCVCEKTAEKVGQRLANVVRRRAACTGQGAAWGCCRNRLLGPAKALWKSITQPDRPVVLLPTLTHRNLQKMLWPAMLHPKTTHFWTYIMHCSWHIFLGCVHFNFI